jgi:uncharacterized protein YpmB
MPSINLAPGTQHIIIARKRRRRLYAIAGFICIVFAVGWGALYLYKQSLTTKSDAITQDIQIANKQIQDSRDQVTRVALFEHRLTDVGKLLDSHIGWGKVFADVERLLPGDTVITSFDAKKGVSTIQIKGRTQNMDQVALALASLTAGPNHPSVFTGGSIQSIQRQEAGDGAGGPVYAFTLVLDFDQNVLQTSSI